ncbi:hypothetical protein D9757_012850 [Collybiopsis confluens]|uniref:Uncharacterized protein n=1 Tax=Collybiopsis confluens TaxID=2823264 RepID=A0A8H5G1L5_9AGAR|nr:hypothetical protein D9757_012850 [Collybiopsis confluens]
MSRHGYTHVQDILERGDRDFSFSPPSTSSVESLKNLADLSAKEWKIVAWMRAHPSKPFMVDAEHKINPLDRQGVPVPSPDAMSLVPTSRHRERNNSSSESEEYERVDLTDEPPLSEHEDSWSRSSSRSRYRNGISPGSFSAVSGNQRIIYNGDGDRTITQNGASPRRSRRRHSGLRAFSSSSNPNSRSMTVSGASVLQGASNFIINGSHIAPGAFCAIAGNQEIWSVVHAMNTRGRMTPRGVILISRPGWGCQRAPSGAISTRRRKQSTLLDSAGQHIQFTVVPMEVLRTE